MKKQTSLLVTTVILVVTISVAAFVNYGVLTKSDPSTEPKPFHVGISFCGDSTAEAKMLIDRVQNYTNLLIIQSGPVSKNQTSLTEIADYATAKGLAIIPFFWNHQRDMATTLDRVCHTKIRPPTTGYILL